MLYHFELQMAGAILLTAMLIGGIYLWMKRRRAQSQLEAGDGFDAVPNDDSKRLDPKP